MTILKRKKTDDEPQVVSCLVAIGADIDEPMSIKDSAQMNS